MDFKCLVNAFEKFGDKYRKTPQGNYMMYLDPNDIENSQVWVFFDNRAWAQYSKDYLKYNDAKGEKSGRWACDGEDEFSITNFRESKKYYSKDDDWKPFTLSPTKLPQPIPNPESSNDLFSCVRKNKGNTAKVDSNGESVWFWVDEPNKVAHIFYKKDNKWVQSKDGTEQFIGRWNCDEDNHFLIVSNDGQSYSSRSDNWEKVTTVGNLNDSFPLKFGSQGPNVVKLQKFLNDKIRTNPLTVNGIFDQKTADKLIEFQKKEGIIE